MTTASHPRTTFESRLPLGIRSLLSGARSRLAIRRERARMYAELEQCSDRELAEMNLSRSEIGRVVRDYQAAA